ncbi:DUF1878 family protein [Virgibacillus litoralis]|uniref:DUF1878 domain-containing protein n=1 Tax=Virgibacillus litoralis TaxID=578221 RepID=A0ABS4H8U8_9BACI|nr:DUF1878 family protein [Virgibacillus litoralis]MBP1947331.1 hypothetical protein [Virgibacillus litoralis]
MEHLDQNEATAFHLCLLAKVINIEQFPFIKLLIQKDISRMEFDETMELLKMLDSQFEEQKEEGFLNFTSLLVHFAGMLSEKLYPNETIYALKKEGYYPSLMNEFIRIIEENEK